MTSHTPTPQSLGDSSTSKQLFTPFAATSSVEERFREAVRALSSNDGARLRAPLTDATKIELYSLFKLAVVGPYDKEEAEDAANRVKSGSLPTLSRVDQYKRNAWRIASEKYSQREAMERYAVLAEMALKQGSAAVDAMVAATSSSKVTAPSSTAPTVMSGKEDFSGVLAQLVLSSSGGTKWHRQFFELRGQALYYYETETKAEYPAGYVYVMDGSSVEQDPQTETRASDPPAFLFSIAHPRHSKRYRLGCDDATQGKRWIAALRAACELTKRMAAQPYTEASMMVSQVPGEESEEDAGGPARPSSAPPPASSGGRRLSLISNRATELYGVPSSYAARVDDVATRLVKAAWDPASDRRAWRYHSTTKSVNIWTLNSVAIPDFLTALESPPGSGHLDSNADPESNENIVGACGEIANLPFPARAVFDLAWTPGARKLVDTQLETMSVVEQLGPQTRIDHLVYAAVWPTSRREFCRLLHYRVLDDGTILVCSRSVEDPMCPRARGAVRARLVLNGFIISPLTSTSCSVKYVIVVDPKVAKIPRSFIGSITANQALLLARISSYLDGLDPRAVLKGPVRNESQTPNGGPASSTSSRRLSLNGASGGQANPAPIFVRQSSLGFATKSASTPNNGAGLSPIHPRSATIGYLPPSASLDEMVATTSAQARAGIHSDSFWSNLPMTLLSIPLISGMAYASDGMLAGSIVMALGFLIFAATRPTRLFTTVSTRANLPVGGVTAAVLARAVDGLLESFPVFDGRFLPHTELWMGFRAQRKSTGANGLSRRVSVWTETTEPPMWLHWDAPAAMVVAHRGVASGAHTSWTNAPLLISITASGVYLSLDTRCQAKEDVARDFCRLLGESLAAKA